MTKILCYTLLVLSLTASQLNGPSMQDALYDLGTPVVSRSISFENPTGAPGQGGQAASALGVGC